MKRKDIIILSVLANSGLLIILLISAINTRSNDLPSSSSKIAEAILEKDDSGMIPIEETISEIEEKIVHKLPNIEKKEESNFFEIIVKKGDSLEKIAKLNNTSVNEIININNLSNSFLRVGQVLKIPKSLMPKEKDHSKIENKIEYYTVKTGDNPWTISMKHHIKVEELLKMNNLDETKAKKLRPGDKLRIR